MSISLSHAGLSEVAIVERVHPGDVIGLTAGQLLDCKAPFLLKDYLLGRFSSGRAAVQRAAILVMLETATVWRRGQNYLRLPRRVNEFRVHWNVIVLLGHLSLVSLLHVG